MYIPFLNETPLCVKYDDNDNIETFQVIKIFTREKPISDVRVEPKKSWIRSRRGNQPLDSATRSLKFLPKLVTSSPCSQPLEGGFPSGKRYIYGSQTFRVLGPPSNTSHTQGLLISPYLNYLYINLKQMLQCIFLPQSFNEKMAGSPLCK
jgi:hypothetical protein